MWITIEYKTFQLWLIIVHADIFLQYLCMQDSKCIFTVLPISCSSSDVDNGPREGWGRLQSSVSLGLGLPHGLGNLQVSFGHTRPNIPRSNVPRWQARRRANRPHGRQVNRGQRQHGVDGENGDPRQLPVPAQQNSFHWGPYEDIDPFTNDWLPNFRQRRGRALSAPKQGFQKYVWTPQTSKPKPWIISSFSLWNRLLIS